MTTVKRYLALAVVFLCIGTGVLLLMVDFDTLEATWMSIAGAFFCIGTGLVLCHIFNAKNMLPE